MQTSWWGRRYAGTNITLLLLLFFLLLLATVFVVRDSLARISKGLFNAFIRHASRTELCRAIPSMQSQICVTFHKLGGMCCGCCIARAADTCS